VSVEMLLAKQPLLRLTTYLSHNYMSMMKNGPLTSI